MSFTLSKMQALVIEHLREEIKDFFLLWIGEDGIRYYRWGRLTRQRITQGKTSR